MEYDYLKREIGTETFITDLISELKYSNNHSYKFIYNQNNQVIEVLFKERLNSSYFPQAFYQYDELGRLSVYHAIVNAISVYEYYRYDDYGRLIEVNDRADFSGDFIKYIYDLTGNLVSLSFSHPSFWAHEINYNYNKNLIYDDSPEFNTQSNLYDKTTFTTRNGFHISKEYNYDADALYRLKNINLKISTFNLNQ